MNSHTTLAPAVLRLKQLKTYVSLGSTSIYGRLDPKSAQYDPTFPKPIRLGGSSRAVGWLKTEIDAWLAAQVAKTRKAA